MDIKEYETLENAIEGLKAVESGLIMDMQSAVDSLSKLREHIEKVDKIIKNLMVEEKTPELERYHYRLGGVCGDDCLEKCKVLDNDIYIGSCACIKCSNCVEHNDVEQWIKCKRIKEATNKEKAVV